MKNSMLNNSINNKSRSDISTFSHEKISCEKITLTDLEDRVLRLKALNDFLNSGNRWPESATFELQDEQTNIINELAELVPSMFVPLN
tara:strand:+ start:165 stop:428 length:264 start_codon:yes stop_codon:yes gene_type:complete